MTEANIEPKIDLDTILVREIGQFGKFQLRTAVLAALIAIVAAWGASEYVFTAARITTRCLIPECDGPQPEWLPYWLPNAVPATGASSYDNCQRYGNSSAISRQVESDTCPSTLFDRNTVQPCEEYVYENTHSVAYDFGLACEEWRRSLIGTIRNAGLFIGLPLNGYVSDRWGRRVALTITAFNRGWIGLTRYWTNTYISFAISEVAESILGSATFLNAYILLLEITGPKYRDAVSAFMNTCVSIGFVTLGLIAWAVPDWRHLTLALYVPQLLTILYFWIISESVRWYMSKGRFDDAAVVLKNVAKTNGKNLSEQSLQALRHSAEASIKKLEDERSNQDPWLIVQVFQHKQILLRCIVIPVWWLTCTFIYDGLSLNAVNMSGNGYLNFVAVSAVEIPGYWTAYFLMRKIGRRPVLIGGFWLCACCQITYIFMPQDIFAVSLTVYLIGKYAIALVMTTAYVYTAELYPTKHRSSLVAFSAMAGRLGAMLAPLTPAIGVQWFEALPIVIYACFALVSGALIFLTPETLNTKLPDTMEEASQISSKTTKSRTNDDSIN